MNFKKELANFIFTSKYARYLPDKKRRESWEETVLRVRNMHLKKFNYLSEKYLDKIKWAFSMVKDKKVVPSMRSLQFGGAAIEKHNQRIYNCAVRHVNSIRAFSEIFHLLLCGCGVGIGITKKFINQLPDLISTNYKTGTVLSYAVEDTIEGWADSIEILLSCYFKNTPFSGRKIIFDYSKIRKEGTQLKTSGGKAPGYKGLKNCHNKIKFILDKLIEVEHVQRLLPIHAYDILMHCSDAVLSGGIRRSASIVIFDVEDELMMDAKTYFEVKRTKRFFHNKKQNTYEGQIIINNQWYSVNLNEFDYKDMRKNKRISWFHIEPQRARSNNSVLLLRDKLNKKLFHNIIKRTRQFGEPGFLFANTEDALCNPCAEINFVPVTKDNQCGVQFCNLTEINGAKINSLTDFLLASEAAALIGTLQAAYTNFDYLHPTSKKLTEEEALLGVSITGIMDNPNILLSRVDQSIAAKKAVETNKKWSKLLHINQAARVTCIKPAGTSSLVLESASGIHPHHSKKYIRRVQCNRLDPVYKHFKKYNSHMCNESIWSANKTDDVISFPIEAGTNVITKKDLSAIDHLKIIKDTQQHWVLKGTTPKNIKPVNHNVSCTVIVKNLEWTKVTNYIYDNREFFTAISFIPDSGDKNYPQAPLEAIVTKKDQELWDAIVGKYKKVDYKKIQEFKDNTKLIEEIACGGGACEITAGG